MTIRHSQRLSPANTSSRLPRHSKRWMKICQFISSLIIASYCYQPIRHNFRVDKDVERLAELAHFLKGSSGQVGVKKVKEECNRMQYYGKLRDEEKKVDLKEEQAIEMITASLKIAKKDYEEAEKLLNEYFDAPGDPPRPPAYSSDSDDPPLRKK